MSVRDRLRRGRQFVLGDHQGVVAFGAVATVVLFFAGMAVDGVSQAIGITGINVSALAGFVTGLALGRGWVRGAGVAFRAVMVGFVLVGVVVTVGLFLLWRAQTGQNFLYWSPFMGGMLLLVAPLFGFAGALGGALGTVLRRVVVPPEVQPARALTGRIPIGG